MIRDIAFRFGRVLALGNVFARFYQKVDTVAVVTRVYVSGAGTLAGIQRVLAQRNALGDA